MKNLFFVFTLITILTSCRNNSLTLKTNDEIQNNFLKIELIDRNKKTTIYENGLIKQIPNFYGENDWKFYYKDSLILKFRHFKTNRHNVHEYTFDLNYVNEHFEYDIEIEGRDDMKISTKKRD